MNPAPRWYLPVAIVALAWNLLGCLAYLADVRLRPEDIAALPAALLPVARQAPLGGPVPYVLQSLVLVVSVALVGLARRAARAGWNRA